MKTDEQRDRRREYNRRYYEKHRSEIRARRNRRYQNDQDYRDAVISQQREYNDANRDLINSRQRERNRNSPEKNRESCARWRRNNPVQRRNLEARHILSRRLRARLYSALRQQGLRRRNGSAVRDLGCTIPELRAHLEALFKPGMTWQNYGEWHIDHITPLSAFDLSAPSQVQQACHFSNLQPLWSAENISKGSRVPARI